MMRYSREAPKMIFCFYFTSLLSFQCFVLGKLMVTQIPNELWIHRGESVNVTCSWNITNAQRIRVEWRKYNKSHPWDDNGTLLSSGLWTHPNNMTIFTPMNQKRSSYVITNDTTMMTLESITEEDEGLYVCKIVSEMPVLLITSRQENGTLLQVHNNKPDDFVFGKLMITQVPNELNIHKGESVTLTCRWNITDVQRIRVEWRKYNKSHPWHDNGTLLSTGLWTHPNNTTIFIVMNQNRSSYVITNDTAMMTLESITEEDEGLYVCKTVSEIPTLYIVQGNGTLLQVHNNKPDVSDLVKFWYLYFIFLIIIPKLITMYCCWKKGKEYTKKTTV
ncbi:uncharacterized protein [Aquarana catesbeiana]|uniref:uncharacterized protein n=1 Tax=Aquarana catesbeiana TaxID=8400 RepID=UPI003CC98CA7